MIVNCSGYPVELLSTLDLGTGSAFPYIFYLLYGFEYLLILMDYALTTLFLVLSYKVKIWHKNMTIILCFYISTFYVFATGRLIMLILNVTGMGKKNCNEMFYIGWFMEIIFASTVIHALPSVVVERWLAYFYLKDYEANDRIYISIAIIVFSVFAGLFFIFTAMFLMLSLYSIIGYIVIVTSISFMAFLMLWKINLDQLKTLEDYSRYTVSQRFQLNENLKLLRNIMFVVIVLALSICAVSVIVPMLSNYEGYLLTPLVIIQDIILFVTIMSIESWRNAIKNRIGVSTPFVVDVTPVSKAGEVYFRNLSHSWNQKKSYWRKK